MQKTIKTLIVITVSLIIIFLIPINIQSQDFSFEQHPIDLDFPGIHAIKVFDLDDDGDLDIIAGSEQTPSTASIGLHWLRNEGGNPVNWTRIPIDASFEHVMSVDVGYIDNDNFPDIVATSWSLHQVAWWKNSGDPTQDWSRRVVKSSFYNSHDAKCSDIDDDGDVDIIAANYFSPGNIIICYNDGNSVINWQTVYLTSSFAGALSVHVIDLDKDDDPDILGTASDADEIAWWKNMGGNPINWTKNVVAINFVGSSDLHVVDLNDDNVYDIIANAWKSDQIAYWICDDIQTNSWSKTTVSTTLDVAAGVSAGDFDKDGDIDIVAAGKIPGELVIYENDNFNWPKITLFENFYGGTALEVIDFDGDSDLDIIAGASYLGELYWWENRVVSSVGETIDLIPSQIRLYQNFPNPFNPSTRIQYSVNSTQKVTLKVYDVLGSEIATLVNEEKTAGNYMEELSVSYLNIPSGVYFYQLLAGNFVETKKMILLK